MGPHTKRHVNMAYQCTKCGNKYSAPKAVKLHAKTHSVKKQYRCSAPSCVFTHYSKSKVQEHEVLDHGFAKKHQCKKCGVMLASTQKLAHHTARCNVGVFPCTYCNKKLLSKSALTLHVRSLHEHTGLPP